MGRILIDLSGLSSVLGYDPIVDLDEPVNEWGDPIDEADADEDGA